MSDESSDDGQNPTAVVSNDPQPKASDDLPPVPPKQKPAAVSQGEEEDVDEEEDEDDDEDEDDEDDENGPTLKDLFSGEYVSH